MKGILVAGTLAALLLLSASSPGKPVLLDAAAFRAEVAIRLAGYTGRLDGDLRRKRTGLERTLEALDSPSSSLDGDLRIVRWTAKALDRPFRTDAPLLAYQDALETRIADLVRGTREGLAACIPAMAEGEGSAEADRRLERSGQRLAASEAAGTRGRRLALLARALLEVRMGLAAVEADAGEPLSSGFMQFLPYYQAAPLPWTPDRLSATVTLDAEGTPLSLEITMVQAPGGGPVTSRILMSVTTGFAGAGTYNPLGSFDPDMEASGQVFSYIYPYGAAPTALVITTWDPEGGRVAGEFNIPMRSASGYMGPSIQNGVFDIRAPIIVRQP